MNWLLLNSGKCDAAFNMALDEALLEAMPRLAKTGFAFLRLDGTGGDIRLFPEIFRGGTRHACCVRSSGVRPAAASCRTTRTGLTAPSFRPATNGIRSRRKKATGASTTGCELAFAELKIETELAPCCKKSLPGQCFAGHEKFDLLWHGKKIAGAAQRRNKLGLLIQGSVQPPPVALPRPDWENAVRRVAGKQFTVTVGEFCAGRGTGTNQWQNWCGKNIRRPCYNQKR